MWGGIALIARARAQALLAIATLAAGSMAGGSTGCGARDEPTSDASAVSCEGCTSDDCDNDGLPNAEERAIGTDPCNHDTDGDAISDATEVWADKICVGHEADPVRYEGCEEDADCGGGRCVGFDPLDPDQDGDGLPDGEEDRNRDGRVGTCRATCDPGACGLDQQCVDGRCTWGARPACLADESDPRLVDSDGDGVPDAQEIRAEVCRSPNLDAVQQVGSDLGNWTMMLHRDFDQVQPLYEDPHASASAEPDDIWGPVRTVTTFESGEHGISGAVIARYRGLARATWDFEHRLREELILSRPDLGAAQLHSTGATLAADGGETRTALYLVKPAGLNRHQVREQLVGVLGPPALAAPAIDPPDGTEGTPFVVGFTFRLHQDAVVILLSVAPQSAILSLSNGTIARLLELMDGTAITHHGQELGMACDHMRLKSLPKIDLVWVVAPHQALGEPAPRPALIHAMDIVSLLLTFAAVDVRSGVLYAGCSGPQNATLLDDTFTRDIASLKDQLQIPPDQPDACDYQAPLTAGKIFYETLEQAGEVAPDNPLALKLRPDAQPLFILVSPVDEMSDDGDVINAEERAALVRFYKDKKIFPMGILTVEGECTNTHEPLTIVDMVREDLEGLPWPICYDDVERMQPALTALSIYMQGIASPVKLRHAPVSSTLRVGLKRATGGPGIELTPSLMDGFLYGFAEASVIFTSPLDTTHAPSIGDDIYVSYARFRDPVNVQ